MKKIIVVFLFLMLPIWGISQSRTYLKIGAPDMYEDMYVTCDGGEYVFHIQLWNWSHFKDSVFMVLGERECFLMQKALSQLNTTYKRWSFAARSHGIRDYTRPIDIYFPSVSFQWRVSEKLLPGGEMFGELMQSKRVCFPQPVFCVDPEGRCFIKVSTILYDNKEQPKEYEFSTCFASPGDIRGLLRRCDSTWCIDEYKKANQSRREEYYNSIFR